ncbi:MAG: helicase, partial [Alphaproteobacteria bacterium]|nr:helicase [Alphaproteobacteria bacterium]
REQVITCNAPFIFDRLDQEARPVFDVLELFAFVCPGKFCVPTPNGIAVAIGLTPSNTATQQALNLVEAAEKLLTMLQQFSPEKKQECITIAEAMAAAAPIWLWSPFILAALDAPMLTNLAPFAREKMSVWRQLPEWEDKPPRAAPSQSPINHEEARAQLNRLVETVIGSNKNRKAEPRPEQADYSSALSAAFQAPQAQGKPHWVLAEAGTGVGKTLGYLAPALAWAAKNDGQIWISTFTRYLQNQLQHDLARIFPENTMQHAVVRKGRENYLCLLNIDENINQFVTGDLQSRIGMGLMLRWITATRDGDLTGGDLPGWMPVLVGTKPTLQMADRRGECIHQACPHYQRCFIEGSIRNSREATVVVANHALTLAQDFSGDDNDDERKFLPSRMIFDEGHHLFEAADSAYAVAFSGQETAELKRWLISEHALKRFRRRGLSQRLISIVGDAHPLVEYIGLIHDAADFLPEPGWLERIHKAMPKNAIEEFLSAVRAHVLSHVEFPNSPYDIEAHTRPPSLDLTSRVDILARAIRNLADRIMMLMQDLGKVMEDDTNELLSKRSIASLIRSLQQRCIDPLTAWFNLVNSVVDDAPENVVDWFAIRRIDGRDIDVGLYRHFIDPMQPLTKILSQHAHGVVITSATLKSNAADNEQSWHQAEQRTGGQYIREAENMLLRVQIPSPFNYAAQTKVILINDIDARNPNELAGGFNALFQAAGGGALGLFTAIKRLQSVHPYLQKALAQKNIPLYAQHVDGLNTATLVDIFRSEEDACLLGTDALRDGVDVPGRALRLVVYDKIPWPRPSILHRARRAFFGSREYDLFLTSIRLRQSFGRLIRGAEDKGVFVLLESALPSALYKAFPPGVAIEKMAISEAAGQIQAFLNPAPYAKISSLQKVE